MHLSRHEIRSGQEQNMNPSEGIEKRAVVPSEQEKVAHDKTVEAAKRLKQEKPPVDKKVK